MDSGTQVGHFEILEPLGKGGMGEVYRARDTRLDRDVAIKVLPAELADDSQRLSRLEREARLLASLNHPNIAAIHGLEETGAEGVEEDEASRPALVLELVEGPTLAERISRGPIPVQEALDVGLQVAEALEAAHRRDIIHRDLKPANVKIAPDSTVKVLDFGLAKALEREQTGQELADAPTLSAAATRAGMILGTAGYMSPEQAKGEGVDWRADVWAFGVVLLEMLTGERVFRGDSASETIASVLKDDPDLEELPPETPVQVRHLIERCLQKDPDTRLQAIGEARIALENILTESGVVTLATAGDGVGNESGRALSYGSRWRWGLLGAVAGVLVAVLAVSVFQLRSEPGRPVTFPIELGTDQPPRDFSGPILALSRDGSRLAVAAGARTENRLYLRSLDRLDPTLLPGTQEAMDPFFSPDGEWIGFFAGGWLKKVAVTGGSPIRICQIDGEGRGGSWGEDGTIVFSHGRNSGLYRVPASGGEPEQITTPDPEEEGNSHRWPQILPDGKGVLFIAGNSGAFTDASIMALSLQSGEVRTVHRGGLYARYLPTGHLVYVHQGTMFTAGLDPDRLELIGSPTPVVEDVLADSSSAAAQYAVSDNGTLIYIAGSLTFENTLHWTTRDGDVTPIIDEPATNLQPTVSPDGSRLALTRGWPSDEMDLWVRDLGRGTMTRLTFGDAAEWAPVWSPDGRWIAYASATAGGSWVLRIKRADGVGEAKQLSREGNDLMPQDWSPDGRAILATETGGSEGSVDIRLLQLPTGVLEGEPFDPVESEPFLATEFDEGHARFSPDGRWIAYISNESGQEEIYVRPFRGGGGKWRVSSGGGVFPVWSPQGDELFYLNEDRIMAVTYSASEGTFSADRPRSIIDLPVAPTRTVPYLFLANLTVAPDGRRFVTFQGASYQRAGGTVRPTVVLNWFEELKRQVPTGE